MTGAVAATVAALRAGADGVLFKACDPESLVAPLLGRLRVHSRVQAAALAGRCGLLDQPEP